MKWEMRGKFVSDCEDTLSNMYAVRVDDGSRQGEFIGAAVTQEAARLMAAAPDLLDACKLAADECDAVATSLVQQYGQSARTDPLAMLILALRTTIAKATLCKPPEPSTGTDSKPPPPTKGTAMD